MKFHIIVTTGCLRKALSHGTLGLQGPLVGQDILQFGASPSTSGLSGRWWWGEWLIKKVSSDKLQWLEANSTKEFC